MPIMHFCLCIYGIFKVFSFKRRNVWLALEWKDIYRVQIYSEEPSDCTGTCGWFVLVTVMSEWWFLTVCVSMIVSMLTCDLKGCVYVCGGVSVQHQRVAAVRDGRAEWSDPQVEWKRETTLERQVLVSEATSPGMRLRSATYTYAASPANPDASGRDWARWPSSLSLALRPSGACLSHLGTFSEDVHPRAWRQSVKEDTQTWIQKSNRKRCDISSILEKMAAIQSHIFQLHRKLQPHRWT